MVWELSMFLLFYLVQLSPYNSYLILNNSELCLVLTKFHVHFQSWFCLHPINPLGPLRTLYCLLSHFWLIPSLINRQILRFRPC